MRLKQELTGIIRKYGHNVYLYRRSANVGSGPYRKVDIKYLEPLEKWTSYRRPLRAGANASSDNFMKLDLEGLTGNYDMCFYFQPEANVKTSDLILEDTPGQITERQVFTVKKAIPYYFGAELIYIAAYSDKFEPTER